MNAVIALYVMEEAAHWKLSGCINILILGRVVMARVNFLGKTEKALYFSLFYAALVLIFFVSIKTTGHVLITIPLLSAYHALTSEHGLVYSIYLAFAGGISAHARWDVFLNVASIIAAIAASTFSIRRLFDAK